MGTTSLDTLAAEVSIMKTDIAILKTDSENHVTYPQFAWIVGILMTIVGGMFVLIWAQLQYVSKTTASTQSTVSFIQGTLQNASISK